MHPPAYSRPSSDPGSRPIPLRTHLRGLRCYSVSVFFRTIPPAPASAAFIRAIWKIRDSISLRSEPPSAVTQAAWSAAGGRGYTGCLSSGKAEPPFVKKRVRCSRGCLPASCGLPRIVGNFFRQLPPLSLPFSLAPSSAALPVRYVGSGGAALGNPPRRLSGDRGRLRPRASRHPLRLPPRQPRARAPFSRGFTPYAAPGSGFPGVATSARWARATMTYFSAQRGRPACSSGVSGRTTRAGEP